MADHIKSFPIATSVAPTALGPVRLFTTGADYGRVVRATGAEDNNVIGIALSTRATAGIGIPVAVNPGFQFNGYVNSAVTRGDKLKIGPGGVFEAAGAHTPTTAQTEPRYTAVALKTTSGNGATPVPAWLEFRPREVV